MAACYHPDARFSDPAFGELRGADVGRMWRMLTGRAKDLEIELLARGRVLGLTPLLSTAVRRQARGQLAASERGAEA